MSLPVSQYEALLAEVRGLRRKAQRVQQLATPLLSNFSSSSSSSSSQNDGVKLCTSHEMEPLLSSSSTNCDDDPWLEQPITKTSIEVTSVMSFASSSGGGLFLGSPSLSRRSSQQLEAKVDMVYSLLAMLSGQEHADMGETLLALSTNPESCLAMRQSGCIPLLVQMVQSDREAETRKKAAQALHNLVHSQQDEKVKKREVRVFKLLEHTRAYTEAVRGHHENEFESEEDDKHPVQTVAHLMKLSFDELHRQAICTLGGIHTIASLVEAEHANHGSTTTEQHCILMRRYACMALTNLTFGDSGNKALLCSYREFMRALVVQLQSPSDELRQVTASVLRNLSWRADATSKEILREVGSVSGLMKSAMLDNKENTLKSILSALWNLSAHCTENKSEICSVEGALGFLVDTLTYKTPSKSLAIIENSGGILRNISSQIAVRDDYREILRRHNCLQILLDQLKSPSLTIVSNACGTLWNLSAKCCTDQELLWQMGAPAMLRSLNHSKHKMIAMGSSAALKNLLSAKPTQMLPSVMDSTALAMDLPVLPTLGARKQKALLHDLDQTLLSETFDNLEKESPKKCENSGFCSLDEASTSYETRKNLSLPYFDDSNNDLNNGKCFKRRIENKNLNVCSDSGLQSFEIDSGSSSIDNDKCKKDDEKDHCSIEDVSDSDNQVCDDSSFSGLTTVRREVETSFSPKFKYPTASSNVTMFEGDIDEIDMDDISIHFEEKQDTENEKIETRKLSGIPLPKSTIKQETNLLLDTPKKINQSSALPRPQTSTPIVGSNQTIKVANIDEMEKSSPEEFPFLDRDRFLERSCEENNPMDNRMLDPDAMIQSLDRFTAELVSQASHLQNDEKYKDNTWNEDTSPNEVTFPSISGSAPNVITFESEENHNDFSSVSTMTESTLIAIEASKMATVFKNEAEMSSSVTWLELDKVQPPSLLESFNSDVSKSPKLTTRKKSFSLVRRVLSNSQNSDSLEQVNDFDTSFPEFVINGSINRNVMTSKLTDLDNINPPSLFNEITDLCNSLSDVPTEAIGSETEIFEDCQTHIDDVTEFSDANSATPIQSDPSSPEISPKKNKTIKKPMTLKEKRNLAKDRYKTYTVAAAEMFSQEEVTTSDYQSIDTQKNEPKTKSSIRKNFLQKRLENKDRFKTQTLSPKPDLDLEKEANLVLKNLQETKTSEELLDCETLSLVSNDDDSEQNSVNYRTYHKSWGLKKNIPVIEPVTKPKIVKPSEEEDQVKAIRGRRKPLYSKPTPKSLKPSNLVRNITTSIKSVAVKPPPSGGASKSKPKLERQNVYKTRSGEFNSYENFTNSVENSSEELWKINECGEYKTSAKCREWSKESFNTGTEKCDIWKKIEESKKQPVNKKDTRVWIEAKGESGGSGGVVMRGKKREGDEGKRVSRLGSFICGENDDAKSRISFGKKFTFSHYSFQGPIFQQKSVNNEAVQVVVRCRPMNGQEKQADCSRVVTVYSNRGVIEVENPKARSENERKKIFTYDAVYDWNASQQCLYDETVRPLVSSVLEGYNGCVFAYGQTGTGKTYTMEGVDCEEEWGVIPRAFQQIWTHINRTTGVEFLVTVRYLEIYMEDIRDLLKIKNSKSLELREITGKGVCVTHLHSQTCQSADDMLRAMRVGNKNRTSGATNMNEHSSRSHAIFQIVIEMAELHSKKVKVGKLNLVDLAGSERQSKTGATGERFKEATKINKALSSLGNVIYALAENSQHIPYRDSKLTRLLQDSLGGNSKTIMIANIGPANCNYEETIITLRYAYRAKSIKNQPIKNEDIKDAKLLALQEEIERLKHLIEMKSNGGELDDSEVVLDESETSDDEDSKKDESKKRLELGKMEVDELAKKLETLESQMVHGGKNIVDSVNENEVRLEQQKLEIAARKKREIEMQQKIELEEESCIELKQVFASLQQQVDFKKDKLKRLYAKLQSIRQEIKDNHKIYMNDRREIEEANDEASMQLRQRFLIIDNFVPPEERSRLINLAQFDEDKDNWMLKKEKIDAITMERPLGHCYRRPISEYAITTGQVVPKYRGENVLDLKLDMPLRITQDYNSPIICPQIKATVTNMILHDVENNTIVVKALPHTVSARNTSKLEHEGKYKQATKFVIDMQNYRLKKQVNRSID
ncbi:LOW QUALITY PROTEIN: uncharacterized protein LOC123010207 [Tribolium madens]|uniref:LOW QUALITY PROTEIN: uncharacterized protein LOC123010207 n=1 Tax=Tribolium madens TaxID=41895 RepID=UPI001CF73D64|nr:LOW QUALITY PROTEIN: uncharacterized protein LOC123010207 [Tribolium madens]